MMNTAVQPYQQQQYQPYQQAVLPRFNTLQYSPMSAAAQSVGTPGIYGNPGFGAASCYYTAQASSEQMNPAIQQLTNVVSQLAQLVSTLVTTLVGTLGLGGPTAAAQSAPQSLMAGGSSATTSAASEGSGGLLDTLNGWLDTGSQFLEDIGTLWDKASPYVDMGYNLISKGWDFATDWLSGGAGKVAGVFKNAVSGIGSFVSGLF